LLASTYVRTDDAIDRQADHALKHNVDLLPRADAAIDDVSQNYDIGLHHSGKA